MDEKLSTSLLLSRPETLNMYRSVFRFHGLATKYYRIYEHAFQSRGIRFVQKGKSRAQVCANPDAVGAMIQALIDNALKYAPAGSEVSMNFSETPSEVMMGVRGLGPTIEEDETERIFEPFYRGKHSPEFVADGMGFGLAAAKLAADKTASSLSFTQSQDLEKGKYRMTEFVVRIPRDIERPTDSR